MHVLTGRNINTIWPMALTLLRSTTALTTDSRNGPVRKLRGPVTTHYLQPRERVLFDPVRDCNPFFHLAEALWMIAGRNDVAFVAQFAKRMAEFSDNGVTFHGAYGNRWRFHWSVQTQDTGLVTFTTWQAMDQLTLAVTELRRNPESRRVVIGIWDPTADLGTGGKDLPCNLSVKLEVEEDRLNMQVFNRSNDVVWGAYGANVVQFSMLQEYLAYRIGVRVGELWQVSGNWHAYTGVLEEKQLMVKTATYDMEERYEHGRVVRVSLMPDNLRDAQDRDEYHAEWMMDVETFLQCPWTTTAQYRTGYFDTVVAPLFNAWKYRDRWEEELADRPNYDWLVAGREWLERRSDV